MCDMPLQDTLRELVEARGAGVTSDAAELRGALDDFLDEDDATLGEVNLLVDAVRLGALTRMVELLDHGASPQAAVAEAGAALARDRGSDDDRRSRWALAVLGYAVGRLDMSAIPTHSMDAGGTEAVPSGTVGSPDAVPTALQPVASPDPAPPTSPVQPTLPVHPATPPPPTPAATAAPARRRTTGLTVLLIALVIGATAGIGIAVWEAQRDDGSGGGDGTDVETVPEQDVVVSYYTDVSGGRLYEVDTETGESKQLPTGNALLPAISPDRGRVAFLDGPPKGAKSLHILDLATGDISEPFLPTGDCAHSLRPGWSPDGRQLAIVCTGAGTTPVGLYLGAADGSGASQLLPGTDFAGTPTWIDGDTFIYGVGDTGTTERFLTYTIGDDEPTPLAFTEVPGAAVSNADWSDSQRRLLFLVHAPRADGTFDPEYGDLWVADADLGNATRLGGPYGHPAWAPESDQIVVTVKDAGGAESLAVLSASDPADVTNLSDLGADPPAGLVGVPAWGNR